MTDWMNDIPRAVVQAQRALRANVPDLAQRFARETEFLRDEVASVHAEQSAGGAVPELAYADIANGRVSPRQIARIHRRGCVVVRGVFDPAQVQAWNEEIHRYIDGNNYDEHARAKAGLDKYFSALASGRPQIFGLYWSRPQMQARQAESMNTTRAFLNRLWTHEKNGTRFFDPDRQANYADRIRRREPGRHLRRQLVAQPDGAGGLLVVVRALGREVTEHRRVAGVTHPGVGVDAVPGRRHWRFHIVHHPAPARPG